MTTDLRNALLIHNPNAGNRGSARRRTLDAARHIFAAGGIQSELAETTGPGHATEIALRAAAEGRGLVIACGGDGTLNEVINGLAANKNGHCVPLALLPGGTANILAKELDLPWDIPSAAEKLVRGTVKEIALGLATPLEQPEKKKYFLSVGGAGPDGMIVYSLDLDLKARLGILAYWWQGVREVFRYSFPHFRLRGTEGVHFHKSDTVICEPLSKNPVYAQVDGEPLARLPVQFKIVPRALKLLVPATPS